MNGGRERLRVVSSGGGVEVRPMTEPGPYFGIGLLLLASPPNSRAYETSLELARRRHSRVMRRFEFSKRCRRWKGWGLF